MKVFKLQIQFSSQKRKRRRVSTLKALRLVRRWWQDRWNIRWWTKMMETKTEENSESRNNFEVKWVGFDYLYGKGGTESSAQDISKLSKWVDLGRVTWHWKHKKNVGEGKWEGQWAIWVWPVSLSKGVHNWAYVQNIVEVWRLQNRYDTVLRTSSESHFKWVRKGDHDDEVPVSDVRCQGVVPSAS